MRPIRVTQIAAILSLAAFALLTAFNNIADYGSNYLFVRHVLSMDTTFPDNALIYRAIPSPAVWKLAYGLIILTEALSGFLLLVGGINLLRFLRAPVTRYAIAKGWATYGLLLAFLLWFLGFTVVGGEWFLMWHSKIWNGQEAAFRFYMTAIALLILLNQPEAV